MEKDILKLREEGKTYNEIKEILGCSKGTISYHCGKGQKEKTKKRNKDFHKKNNLYRKVDRFKKRKQITDKTRDFQRKNGNKMLNRSPKDSFSYGDVEDKVGDNPKCYLTGRDIDLDDPYSFNFDHIIPAAKGGSNSLSNLGITCREANLAKSDLKIEEFLSLCKEVLVHHGYKVENK